MRHSSIIKLFEIYENETYIHLVFENIKGACLNSFNKYRGKYNEGDVSKMAKALLISIDFLHEQNVIHRDINPEIIMFKY